MTDHSPTRITVLGAGTMGSGIAQVAALSGYQVVLRDLRDEVLQRGLARIQENLAKGIQLGKVEEARAQAARQRIQTTTDLLDAVEEADLIIEAVPEQLELKRTLFWEVSRRAPGHAILATNTSSLCVTEIASAAQHSDQVIGMHFFNPVHIMTLCELVTAEQTSEATLATVRQVAATMDREVIVVRDSPGFATSRLGLVLGLEAMRMLEEGVAGAEEIDRAMMLGYRHPMGPLKLTDLVGLDVRLAIAEYLHAELGERFRPPQILKRLVRAGHLGKKSGKGFYPWK